MPTSRSQSMERATLSRRGASRSARSPARCDPAYSSISQSSVGVDESCLRHVDVEELRKDALVRRVGCRAAVPAVLDHSAHDELGVVRGTIAALPRLDLLPPVCGGGLTVL